MKTARQWHDELLAQMNRPPSFAYCCASVQDIEQIQEDAMAEIKSLCQAARLSLDPFEDKDLCDQLDSAINCQGTLMIPEMPAWNAIPLKELEVLKWMLSHMRSSISKPDIYERALMEEADKVIKAAEHLSRVLTS